MTKENELIRRGDALSVVDDYEFQSFIRAIPAVAAPEITIEEAFAKVRAWAEEMFIVDSCVNDREPECISCTILTALEAMEDALD